MDNAETKKATANPINPTGKPRGVAKRDVYADLARMDALGPSSFRPADLLRVQGLSQDSSSSPRPSLVEAASLLLERADRLKYHAEFGSEEWLRGVRSRLQKIESRNACVEEVVSALRRFSWEWEEAQEDEALRQVLVERERTDALSPAEALALEDLYFIQGEIAAAGGESYGEAKQRALAKLREVKGRSRVRPPDWADKEARGLLRRRRHREAEELRAYERQLGRLSNQGPFEQQRTIADWRRNARRQGYLPRPER